MNWKVRPVSGPRLNARGRVPHVRLHRTHLLRMLNRAGVPTSDRDLIVGAFDSLKAQVHDLHLEKHALEVKKHALEVNIRAIVHDATKATKVQR